MAHVLVLGHGLPLELGVGVAGTHLAHAHVALVHHAHKADAAIHRADEHTAERGIDDAVGDEHPFPTAAPRRTGHLFDADHLSRHAPQVLQLFHVIQKCDSTKFPPSCSLSSTRCP